MTAPSSPPGDFPFLNRHPLCSRQRNSSFATSPTTPAATSRCCSGWRSVRPSSPGRCWSATRSAGACRAVERQLGGIDAVAFLPRPVRASIADGLPGTVAPVLLLPGSVQAGGDPATAPALGHITILGVDERFAPAGVSGVDWTADKRKNARKGEFPPVVLSARVAEKLGVKAGDRVRLGVESFSGLPRSSSFAKRDIDDVTKTEELEVAAVLARRRTGERLQPDAQPGRAAERVRPDSHALAVRDRRQSAGRNGAARSRCFSGRADPPRSART